MRRFILAIGLLAAFAPGGVAWSSVPQAGAGAWIPPSNATVEAPGTAAPSEHVLEDIQYQSRSGWDWRDDHYDINHGDGLETVSAPWISGVPGLQNRENEPEDGWTLVVRDFGDASLPAAQLPFFVLYNRHTGILRFFAYMSAEQLDEHYSSSQVVLRFLGNKTRNLSAMSLQQPLSKFDLAQVDNVLTPGLENENWIYADFTMNYDPTVANVASPVFAFEIWGVSESTVDLDGEVNLRQQQLGITNTEGGSPGAAQILGGVWKATKRFDQAAGLPGWARGRAEKQKYDWLETVYNDIGSFLEEQPWIPFAAGAWSLFDTFLGKKTSKPAAPTYVIDGQIDLTGTINTEEFILNVLLRVPGADHQGNNNYLPADYDVPLGVFALDGHSDDPCGRYSQPTGPGSSTLTWIWHLNGNPLTFLVNPHAGVIVKELTAAWAFPALRPQDLGPWVEQHVANGDYVLVDSADKYDANYYQYRTRFFDFEYFQDVRVQVPWSAMTYPGWDEVFPGQSSWTVPVVVKAIYGVPGRPVIEDALFMTSYDVVYTSVNPDDWPGSSPNFVLPSVVDLAPGTVIAAGERVVHEAADVIQGPASGTYTVDPAGELILHSAGEVILQPGFTATAGSVIRAHLGEPRFDESDGYGAAVMAMLQSGELEGSWAGRAAPRSPATPSPARGGERPSQEATDDIERLELSEAYPNPALGGVAVQVGFALPADSRVSLVIYDVLGREVATLVDETVAAGRHSAVWDGTSRTGERVAAGVYFARLVTPADHQVRKLIRIH